jgi:hypothetical protein
MIAGQEVVQDRRLVQDHRYRRVLIAAVLVAVATASGFGIGRTTAGTTGPRADAGAQLSRPIQNLGPMSDSDHTRYEVYRKLNRIGPLRSDG